MNNIKNNRLIFIALVVLVLAFFGFFLFNLLFPVPKIKSLSPQNGSAGIAINTVVAVDFEKNISSDRINVVVSPVVQYYKKASGKVLEVIFSENLKFSTSYSAVIKDKISGQELGKTVFTTIQPQGSPDAVNEANKALKDDYPLALFKPDNNANYYFVYTGPKKLRVFLKGNKSSSQKEFEEWVKSKEVNISAHQIEYLSPP